MTLPCLGIWISTIYLRQHYLVDLFGGLVLSVFALWLVRPRPESHPGRAPERGLQAASMSKRK